ncbi:unnamed protein product [Cuscuta campestris]|uniref:Uncharacterized protein n=1 Tax=Cuscuta campestris TaxID=132261 RepID=A0A484MF83_9ASTE|nr:unnamed protein product [Cuscuta campestris]
MAGSICGVKRVWENPNFSAADFSDPCKHKMQKVSSARCDFSEDPNLVSLGESEYEEVSGKSAVGSDDDDDGYSKNQFVGEFVLADPNLGKEVDGIWEESDEEEKRDCEPSEEAIVISCEDDGDDDGYSDPNVRKEVDGIWEESDEEERDCEPSEEAIVISCGDDGDDDGYSRDQFVGKYVLADPNLHKEVDGIWEESDGEEERDCELSEEAIAISCDDDGYSRDQLVGKFVLADSNLGKQVDGIWEESDEEEESDYDHSEEAVAISYDDDGDEYSTAKQELWGTESCGDDVVYSTANILADIVASKPKGQIYAKRDFPDGCRQSAAINPTVDSDDNNEYHEEEEEEIEQGINCDDYDAVYSTANLLGDIVSAKSKRRIYAKRNFPDGSHQSATIKPTLDLDDDDEYYEELESQEEESEEEMEQEIGFDDDDDDAANLLGDIVAAKPKGRIYAKRNFPDGCHRSATIKPTLDLDDDDEYYEEEEEESEEEEYKEEIEQGIGQEEEYKPRGRIYAKRDFPDGCHQSAAIKPVLGSDDNDEYYMKKEELECQEEESKEDFPEGCYPMSQSQSLTSTI